MRKLRPILCLVFVFLTLGFIVWLNHDGYKNEAEFAVRILTALGVLFAVLMALYGDAMRGLFDRIELQIRQPDREDNFPNVGSPGSDCVICRHLLVSNLTPHRPVINCRVWLVGIEDDVGGGNFQEVFIFGVPRLMTWAPNDYSCEVRNFSEDQVFDFGKINVSQSKFELTYNPKQTGAFLGECKLGKTRRYIFRISADNYIKSRCFTVEVKVRKVEPTGNWSHPVKADIQPLK